MENGLIFEEAMAADLELLRKKQEQESAIAEAEGTEPAGVPIIDPPLPEESPLPGEGDRVIGDPLPPATPPQQPEPDPAPYPVPGPGPIPNPPTVIKDEPTPPTVADEESNTPNRREDDAASRPAR